MQIQEIQLLAVNWEVGLFYAKEGEHIFAITHPYDKLDNKCLSNELELEEALTLGKVDDIRQEKHTYFSYSTLVRFIEDKMEEVFYEDNDCSMSNEELENFLHELPLEAIELFVQDLEKEVSVKCYSIHQYDFAMTLSQAPALKNETEVSARLDKVIQSLEKHHLLFDLPKPGSITDASEEIQRIPLSGSPAADLVPEVGQATGDSREGMAS